MVNNRKGFTLVEVIVVLAVIAILAGIAIPLALRIFQVTAEDATNTEMQNLKKAMIGDSGKLQSSVRSDFGFLGDIGCLPTAAFGGPALERLLTQGTYPGFSFSPTPQIGAGWKGPYITGAATGEATAEFTKDQWGNAYTYTTSGGCPLTATFKSAGPDGVAGNTDDIDFSIASTETSATVSGFIKDPNGNPVQSASVTANFPSNGSLTTSSTTTNSAGFYSVSNIPFGKRSINVTPKLIVTSARALSSTLASVCGGGVGTCTYVEFSLVNFTTTAVTNITSLTATFSGGAFYYRINWDGTNVFNSPNTGVGSGTARSITSSSVGAATTALAPFVFTIDNAQAQLADIKIGASGQIGTASIVQIINFRTVNNNNSGGSTVSMSGIPFTVTFSDGSTVQFTPQ